MQISIDHINYRLKTFIGGFPRRIVEPALPLPHNVRGIEPCLAYLSARYKKAQPNGLVLDDHGKYILELHLEEVETGKEFDNFPEEPIITTKIIKGLYGFAKALAGNSRPFILDIGSGISSVGLRLAERGCTVVAVEPARELLAIYAQKNHYKKVADGVWKHRLLNYYLVVADAQSAADVFGVDTTRNTEILFLQKKKRQILEGFIREVKAYRSTFRFPELDNPSFETAKSWDAVIEKINGINEQIEEARLRMIGSQPFKVDLVINSFMPIGVDLTPPIRAIMAKGIAYVKMGESTGLSPYSGFYKRHFTKNVENELFDVSYGPGKVYEETVTSPLFEDRREDMELLFQVRTDLSTPVLKERLINLRDKIKAMSGFDDQFEKLLDRLSYLI